MIEQITSALARPPVTVNTPGRFAFRPPGHDVQTLVVCWRYLWFEGSIPRPVGAFADGTGTWWDIRWGIVRRARQRTCGELVTVAVDDNETVGGPGDGEIGRAHV